jgi:gamma-glutamyltranspeptidase/glutathione hydrolase
MAPLLLLRDGHPVLCVGSPGGRRIVDRNLQVLLNHLLFGMSPQEALVQPTVDASSLDTFVESRMPEQTTRALEALGHRVRALEDEPGATDNFAHPQAIAIDHERGLLRAGVEALRTAVALGY